MLCRNGYIVRIYCIRHLVPSANPPGQPARVAQRYCDHWLVYNLVSALPPSRLLTGLAEI